MVNNQMGDNDTIVKVVNVVFKEVIYKRLIGRIQIKTFISS
nr:hypothetical protein [Polaribacter cellanae]